MPIKKKGIPVGMIIILVLIGYGDFGILMSLFRFQVNQLGPLVLNGASAVAMSLIIFVVVALIFFGILKRYKWARTLAIVYYIFSMILAVVNILSLMANKDMYTELYGKFLTPQLMAIIPPDFMVIFLSLTLVFSLAICIAVLVYVIRSKEFFTR